MSEHQSSPDENEIDASGAQHSGIPRFSRDSTSSLLTKAGDAFEFIRMKLINCLEEPQRSAFWRAVEMRDAIRDTRRGNYEDRHPSDMVMHPLSEIREWDEALAVLGIQDSDQTPADAIRERDAEIERLRCVAQPQLMSPGTASPFDICEMIVSEEFYLDEENAPSQALQSYGYAARDRIRAAKREATGGLAQPQLMPADIAKIISEGWQNGKSASEIADTISREMGMPNGSILDGAVGEP